jgi:hypothetical protein
MPWWEIILVWVCFKLLDWLWLKLRPALGVIVEHERKFWVQFVPYLSTAAVVAAVMLVALLCPKTDAKPESAPKASETRYNIVRVVLHDVHMLNNSAGKSPVDRVYQGVYSVWSEGKDKELVPFYFSPYQFRTWLYKDVPVGEPMYVKFTNEVVNYWEDRRYCEIHIHSENEINGAGWDHGKGGAGQISLVE